MRTIYVRSPMYVNNTTNQRLESIGEMLYTTFVTLAGEISCAIGDVNDLLCALARLVASPVSWLFLIFEIMLASHWYNITVEGFGQGGFEKMQKALNSELMLGIKAIIITRITQFSYPISTTSLGTASTT